MIEINNFIATQTSPKQEIAYKLREIILAASPLIEESWAYNAPFFDYLGHICYINIKKKEVDLGFVDGFELSNEQGLLEAKDRKQIKTITFKYLEDIKNEAITEIVLEAIWLKEEKAKAKKKGKK